MVMLKIVWIQTASWSCFLRFIFGIYLLTDNSGVPLFPVDKWDICHDHINLISEQLDKFWNIDPTPSISQPLFRSHSQSHYFKRQFSKSELLPKITIKTLDGNIKHVKERRVTTDSEGNLQLFVPPGQTMGSSENR